LSRLFRGRGKLIELPADRKAADDLAIRFLAGEPDQAKNR
jgi:hypothetical protein